MQRMSKNTSNVNVYINFQRKVSNIRITQKLIDINIRK